MPDTRTAQGTLPRYIPLSLAFVVGMLVFRLAYGQFWPAGASRAIFELITLILVTISAGGYGYLLLRLVAPKAGSTGLRVVTAILLGLMLFAMAMLAAGTLLGMPGSMVCWSILAVGGLLAGLQGRSRLQAWQVPKKFDGRSFYFILIAIAAAIWLAGAATPPMVLETPDVYDVLEYHLQVPREFYQDGRIHPLHDNAYSFYPMGMEMLYLGSMCLRGGPYAGMYLAKLMPGLLGALAAAGIFFALKKDSPYRAYFGAGLVMTAPAAQYLGWLAFNELGMLAGLTLALLWLRQWWSEPSARSAAVLGLCVGVALTMKYLAVGFVAAPLAVAMLGMCLAPPRGRRLAHWLLAGGVAVAVFSPWMLRDTLATGNPVFPLATSVFGQGHWSDEVAQRFRAGHQADPHAPVPVPPGYVAPAPPDKLETLWKSFLGSQWFGQVALVLVAVAAAALAATHNSLRKYAWDWAMLAILAIQIALWVQVTRGMPWRFLAPAVVPIALLAAGGLERLAKVRHSPWDKDKTPGKKEGWGVVPACGIFAVAVLVNAVASYGAQVSIRRQVPPLPAEIFSQFQYLPGSIVASLPADSKVLVVGDAQAFYYPPNVVYATVFDNQPLATEDLDQLRARGITHILVDWPSIWRLAGTYGFPAPLSAELFDRWQADQPPHLAILDRLGAKPVTILPPTDDPEDNRARLTVFPQPVPTSGPAGPLQAEDRSQWRPFQPPRTWPWCTLYALPPADAPPDWTPAPLHLRSYTDVMAGLGVEFPTSQPASQPATQPAN